MKYVRREELEKDKIEHTCGGTGSVHTPVHPSGGTAEGVVPPGIPTSEGRQPAMEGPGSRVHVPHDGSPTEPVMVTAGAPDAGTGTAVE